MGSDGMSRRAFVGRSGAVLAGSAALAAVPRGEAAAAVGRGGAAAGGGQAFVDIHRAPDLVRVLTDSTALTLTRNTDDRWSASGCEVTTAVDSRGVQVTLAAPSQRVTRIQLRWQGAAPSGVWYLGDAWERAYGDLTWAELTPIRAMPWYFIVSDGQQSNCYGVLTGPAAFCFWQVDSAGLSLWADVRSGGVPVELGSRLLEVCTAVTRSSGGADPFDTLHAFCQQMCPGPRLPAMPIYGHNDWDFYYGHQTAQSTLDVTRTVVSLSPTGPDRPFIVIDDGWEGDSTTTGPITRGPWDHGNGKFPDMPGLASQIKELGARPGLWIRPTSAWDGLPDSWRLANRSSVLDPTVPDAEQQISTDIARLRTWGYELVKHDFTSFDIMGRWGFDMGSTLTDDGWTFREGAKRTTAEVILQLYKTIRTAAGDMTVLGCNTFSHLAAGVFEAMRIGDDTSGTDWQRTWKMGVNCLAFRSAQNGAFYAADPDIAPITKGLPWELSREWLDLVGLSGAVLFTAIDPSVFGPDQQSALRTAFADATRSDRRLAQPVDWMDTIVPTEWRLDGGQKRFDWFPPEGASPF